MANDYVINVGTANTGPHWGAMNGGVIRIKAGARLRIRNNDTVSHRIHTGGGVGGFDHQPAPGTGAGGTLDANNPPEALKLDTTTKASLIINFL